MVQLLTSANRALCLGGAGGGGAWEERWTAGNVGLQPPSEAPGDPEQVKMRVMGRESGCYVGLLQFFLTIHFFLSYLEFTYASSAILRI